MKNAIDYTKKVLEVNNLKQHFKVGFGKNKLIVRAVDGISFDVYKKEVFGLVGESGCGKTTTGRTIMRLYKPTNGEVILEGNTIGSGSGDLTVSLDVKKREYKLESLKLNQYKYDKYLVNRKFDDSIHALKQEIVAIKQAHENQKAVIRKDETDYKKAVYDANKKHEVDQERILFNYQIERDKLLKQTKNQAQIEYEILLKGLNETLKKKLQGIKESAALSNEAKLTHKSEILAAFEAKKLEIEAEMLPKIKSMGVNILSKEAYKQSHAVIKKSYLEAKLSLSTSHKNNLLTISKPDTESIKSQVANLNVKTKEAIAKIHEQIKVLKVDRKAEIAKVNSRQTVDMTKQEALDEAYKTFKAETKQAILKSKEIQKSSVAEKNAKKMQMIFQDPISSLNPRMTVLEIVSEGLVIAGEKDKKVIQDKVIETLKLVGLAPEYISRYPHEFSGGQRQRIGIARALIMNPSVIIADEPISALDVSIKAQVINLLSDLKDQLDLTIMFIAHDLSVVKFFCDRIAVMYFGKIVELTTSEELFKNPLHPYTKSLLSAIPQPDPDYEKKRERTSYSPSMHNYKTDKPKFVEIKEGHFIYANNAELAEMRKKLGVKHENN